MSKSLPKKMITRSCNFFFIIIISVSTDKTFDLKHSIMTVTYPVERIRTKKQRNPGTFCNPTSRSLESPNPIGLLSKWTHETDIIRQCADISWCMPPTYSLKALY